MNIQHKLILRMEQICNARLPIVCIRMNAATCKQMFDNISDWLNTGEHKFEPLPGMESNIIFYGRRIFIDNAMMDGAASISVDCDDA